MDQTVMTCVGQTAASAGSSGQVRARKEPRFQLKQGFVAYSARNFCEIRNISENGIGLQYLAHSGTDCDEMSEINILNNLEGFMIHQLTCRIIYVKDMQPPAQHGNSLIRKVGLHFMDLSADQQEQVHDLIARFSTGQDTCHH